MTQEKADEGIVSDTLDGRAVIYNDALQPPFVLEGFPWRDPTLIFNRLPASFTEKEIFFRALQVSRHTAGGAIRFRGNSPHLTLRAELAFSADMNHMPRAGSAGFDFYRGSGQAMQYCYTVQPASGQVDIERTLVADQPAQWTDWTLYLPLYGAASKIEIGIAPGTSLAAPTPHTIEKPILFYGSSITQGGCASRPGNAYTSMLCRVLDAPQINMGFSSSGRGEPAVAHAIADLDLAAFVMDYDHNAPTPEYLRETHEPFFQIIRKRQPHLPIVLLSRCDFWDSESDRARRTVIQTTYDRARQAGDQKVWFVDGAVLFGQEDREACTVDRCHPNDLGFYRMYRAVLPSLREALS